MSAWIDSRDDRGQSFTYLLAFSTIIMFAVAYAVLQTPMEKLLDAADGNCRTAACTTGTGHVETAWTWLPLVAVALVFLMIVAAGIFMSRRP